VALAASVGVGVLLTQLMMSPPGHELRELALYLATAGLATLAAGWLVVQIAARVISLSIRGRMFAAAAAGTGIALLNVLIVAELMFISTDHDLKLLIALVAFSGVATLSFTLWAAHDVGARINHLSDGIRNLAAGHYHGRVDVAGDDEVAALARDVNALAARLLESSRQRDMLDRERRDLTAAISHDLRTPLASVRAMIEALEDHVVAEPAEVARYYDALRRELDRLGRMIDDLFELARIDAGALRLERHPVALQEIAAEVVDAMQAQARRRGVALAWSAAADTPAVDVDGARLERAVSNLIQNALEHTPEGGRIDVSVGAANGHVELLVADSGRGIAPEDLPHIWDRFYRADKSRNRAANGNADGAGLGLAIVRGVVEAHGGVVGVRSFAGKGTTFAIKLPRD
jgi:signal transduction histidine kinase